MELNVIGCADCAWLSATESDFGICWYSRLMIRLSHLPPEGRPKRCKLNEGPVTIRLVEVTERS